MRKRLHSDEQRRGSALMLALLLVIILGAGSAAAWKHMHVTLARGQEVARKEMALQLAEAGVDKAVATLQAAPGYRGERDTPLGAGAYTVEVTPVGKDKYHIESWGILSDEGLVRARCGVQADLGLTAGGGVRSLRWVERRRMEP